MGFIYKLTYKESRKAYIGQTIRPIEERLKEHQLERSKCKAISGAIKKHGWDNFDKEWYEVPDEDLNFYEEMLVALLGTLSPGGYNLQEGGGATGKPSKETKQKMREAHTGIVFSTEHCANIAASKVGRVHTSESRRKIGAAQKGKRNSLEMRTKLSKSNMGANNPTAIPVCVFGKLYPCGKDASDVVRAEHNPQNSKGNFIWNWTKSKKHKHHAFTVSKEFYVYAIANKLENITRNFYDNWNM